MTPNKINALVVSGGGFSGHSIIKGLRMSPLVKVVLADCYEENIGKYFCDFFYKVPEVKEEKSFIDAVVEICGKENINIIFPSTDYELTALSSNIPLFSRKNILVAVSDSKLLDTLRNKLKLYRFLSEVGLPVMHFFQINDKTFEYPAIGKPVYGFGGKGFITIQLEEDLKKYDVEKLTNEYVWQRLLDDFEEYSADFAINFDTQISDIALRRRLRTSGGFAIITESIVDNVALGLINRMAENIANHGGKGIFNAQLIKSKGNIYISDVNPRVGTSALFSYPYNLNFPLFLCSHIEPSFKVFGKLGARYIKKRIKMVRYIDEFWIETDGVKIKGIVFDLDDTLINQKRWIIDKLIHLWELFNNRLPEKNEFIHRAMLFLEEGNRSTLIDALCESCNVLDLRETFIDVYRSFVPKECQHYDDTVPVLQRLRELGLKLAILTDNPPGSQKQKLNAAQISNLFDSIIFTREIGIEKPDPGAFRAISEALCIKSKELAMVGDNLYRDVIGSIEAGFGRAYLIKRQGGFFNFDEKILSSFFPIKYKYSSITSLREVLHDFDH